MNKHLAPIAALLALTAAPLIAQTPGNLTFERWTGISSGVGVNLLKEKGISQRPANLSQLLPSAATAQNLGDQYGARLRGTFTAPVTANYTFFISSDDNGELWLSETPSGMSKQLVADHTGWTGFNVWDKYDTQRSRVFTLKAGQSYYIEALMRESGGGDHLSIGWSYEAEVTLAQTDIGAPVTAKWTKNSRSFSASVISGDIWGSSDRCSTLLRPWNGDGEFITRISGMNNPHPWARAGIMVRSGTGANAQNAMVSRTGANGMTFQYRTATGSQSNHSLMGADAEWVKLVRKKDVLCGYVSEDGVTWVSLRSVALAGLPETIYVGFAASSLSSAPLTVTFSDFSAAPLTASEVIPASQLTSFAADPLDADGDNLPDAWQSQFPISGTAFQKSEFGDPDDDLITNLEESQLGTDPCSPSGKPAHWLRERWYGTTGYDVSNLLEKAAFYQTPNFIGLTTGSVAQQGGYSGTRLRSILTAPQTGDYIFWISGRGATEVWLSTDASKYAKQRIAVMGASAGTGHGVSSDSSLIWDSFASQMSVPIHLVAGQRYFLEILGQNGHVAGDISLAWARPGGQRERFDTRHIISYAREAADADDDYLPDAWEIQYGLNSLDNGLGDMKKQGERGDYDSDGLSNREEYLLGTDPTNSDTDGDGVSDCDEVNYFKTSPTQSNSITGREVPAPALASYNAANTTANWRMLDGGLMSDSFRGKIEWSFTVPSDGWWVIDLSARLRGTLRNSEEVDLGLRIDGKALAPQKARFLNSGAASVKVITPFLTAGTHTFELDIRNEIGRRSLQILSLKVLGAGGYDGDNNGRPDWLDAILAGGNSVLPLPAQSLVSPLFIEGSTRHLGAVGARAAGQAVTVLRGLGDQHWFADVPLQAASPTSLDVVFENKTQSQSIEWTRWNALGGAALTIRRGDSVKIGAWLSPQDSATVTIAIGGQTQSLAANAFIVKNFAQAGVYPITVTHNGAAKTAATITVLGADFGVIPVFYAASPSWRSFPHVPLSLRIGGEPSLTVESKTAAGTGQKVLLRADRSGRHGIAARLPESGAIVALTEVSTVGFSDALRHDAAMYVGSTADGFRILRTPVLVTDLPPGGRVVMTIFRAGVTFMDGTTVMELNAEDFRNGVAYVDFRYPANMAGGYCHYTDIYDADGRHLGRR